MKKFTWREFALVLAPLFLLLLPYVAGVDWLGLPSKNLRDDKYRHACNVNMRNVGLTLKLYAQDFNGKLPLSTNVAPLSATPTKTSIGWVDALIPYSGGGMPTLSICPASGIDRSFSPSTRNYTTFWFNANLSGIVDNNVTSPTHTLCLGDGNDGSDLSNATYSKSSLPASWLSDTNSPAYRHLGGANYLMVDGSIHWLKPQQVTTFGGRKNAFAIK